MSDDKLTYLDRLHDAHLKASPREWTATQIRGAPIYRVFCGGEYICEVAGPNARANTTLITTMRNDLTEVITTAIVREGRIDWLQKELRRMQAELDVHRVEPKEQPAVVLDMTGQIINRQEP